MHLPFAVLLTSSLLMLACAAGAVERGIAAGGIGPQDFQAQDAGLLPGMASPIVPDNTPAKPYLRTFADALARSLGIDLQIRNGRADLFTFHATQRDTLALTVGGGSSGTFLNLRWRVGQ